MKQSFIERTTWCNVGCCYCVSNTCLLLFQYGEIEEINVCDNLGDHLVGNVYVKVPHIYLL